MQYITVCLGGRVAEELIFDDITTGASQDIKQATATARSMITKYGMSENLGLVAYDSDSDEVFIGRDWGAYEELQRECSRSHRRGSPPDDREMPRSGETDYS